MQIEIFMAVILGIMLSAIFVLSQFLEIKDSGGNWLPLQNGHRAKRQFELYSLHYTVIWIALFGVVVVMKLYETFDANSYLQLCVSLSLPFLLQPILMPLEAEKNLPLTQRYSFKANLWIVIFSFIGNYWYTHYFYNVLKASYTFPAHRLNDVPIALYFATHFYFVTYHTFSNLILRKIETRYNSGIMRTIFFWACVCAFSYFTAFMETLTISSFPCYAFEDRYMAYTLGSAFYGIYFLASFPIFYNLDKSIGEGFPARPPHDLYQTCLEAFGCSMIVLCLLDFCRVYLQIDLNIAGSGALYLFENMCSFN